MITSVVLLLLIPSAIEPIIATDEIIDVDLQWPGYLQDSVSRAISLVSDVWNHDGPIFPPMDATSIIREISSTETEGSTLTRSNPIPTSWDLVSENTHSRIFVEDGLTIPSSDIQALGDIFDDSIYPNATDWFHPDNPYDVIDIRIYDFGDGPGNTGGFFLGSYPTRNDLFVDSQDLQYSRSWSFEIVAHEFQHLLHYDLDPDEEVWLNEGLADLSARVTLGPGTQGIQSHIDTYETHPRNDLLLWDEGQPPDYIETIADYGRAYAFVSYLAYHYGGKDFIRDITADSRNSVSSINGELAEDGEADRFNDIVAKEKGANIIDDPIYGGGIYNQDLIDIGIRSLEFQTSSYPASHTITDTVRYSGYYLRFLSGSPSLSISIDPDSYVHALLVGTNGGVVTYSANLSGDGSEPLLYRLSGFDVDYDVLYVIVHTTQTGSSIDVSVDISDLEPPETDVLVSPPNPTGKNGYYLDTPGISLETSEGSYVMYAWDEGLFQEYTTSLHPPEGPSTLYFFAQGPFGLKEDERELKFKVDTIDPVTSISIDPEDPDGENGYYISDPLIGLDTEDQMDVTFYDIGNGPVRYVDPFRPGHGDWNLEYWSEDLAGRTDESKRVEIKIDLGDPTIELVVDPRIPDGDSGFYSKPPMVTLVVEGGAEGWFLLNGEGPYQYSSPFELEDGEWAVQYYAATSSGRAGTVKTSYFKVDTTPPDLQIEFDPPLCTGWCIVPTYMTLLSKESGTDIMFDIADGGPYSYSSPVLLGDGEYSVSVWAVDPAGNRAEGETFEIMIDNTPPITELVLDRSPESGDWSYDIPPSLGLRTILPPVSAEITYVSLDGVQYQEYTGQEMDFVPGRNTVHFFSQDLAGNTEPVRRRDINIDTSPPTAVLSSNRTIIAEMGLVKFSVLGSTDDIEVYRFMIDFGDGEISDWIYGTEVSHHYDGLGKFNVIVTVEDAAGRTNEREESLTIEVLSQEDYQKRTQEGGTSILVLVISLLLALIALVSIPILVIVLVKKRRDINTEEVMMIEESEIL